MDYKDIDYSKYLSVDNGKGILLSKEDALLLEKYDIDYRKYSNLGELIFDIESLIEEVEDDELEDICFRLSEIYYYNYVNK